MGEPTTIVALSAIAATVTSVIASLATTSIKWKKNAIDEWRELVNQLRRAQKRCLRDSKKQNQRIAQLERLLKERFPNLEVL
jgi:flagellar motility protein MotE (MotC chaperone)